LALAPFGRAKGRWIAGKAQRRELEVRRLDLPGAIPPCLQLLDTLGIDIKADDRASVARERRSDRQADLAQPNNSNLSVV
jgi:hypothetical protein